MIYPQFDMETAIIKLLNNMEDLFNEEITDPSKMLEFL